MIFTDRLPVTRTKKLASGYLAGVARVARGGNVQNYRGDELGRPDLSVVRVYRPEDEVFSDEAMRSFASMTMTDDHPVKDGQGILLDAETWRGHTRGHTSPKVTRDGEYVEVEFLLMDADIVSAVERGDKRELSMGYTSELVWGDGVSPKGEKYDATMKTIRGNHVAVVKAARGGSELKIGDSEERKPMQKILFDGIEYEATPQTAQLFATVQKRITDAQAATEKVQALLDASGVKVKELQDALDKANAEKTALETKLADATNPAKLADAAKVHGELVAKATAMVPGIKLDGLDAAGIRKAVVDAKLPAEKVKGYTVATYDAAFDILADGVVVAQDSIAAVLRDGGTSGVKTFDLATLQRDAETAQRERNAEIQNAYKHKEPAATQ